MRMRVGRGVDNGGRGTYGEDNLNNYCMDDEAFLMNDPRHRINELNKEID